MKVQEFENRLQAIRAMNGWRIELDFGGIWEVRIYDKETGKLLAWTGSTRLEPILDVLEIPFDQCPWI